MARDKAAERKARRELRREAVRKHERTKKGYGRDTATGSLGSRRSDPFPPRPCNLTGRRWAFDPVHTGEQSRA